MKREELDAIRERAEAATPGKWTIAGRPPCVVDRPLGDDKKVIVYGMDSNVEGQRDNWDDLYFIAKARADVPALLAEVERLQAKLSTYEALAQENDYYAIFDEMGDTE